MASLVWGTINEPFGCLTTNTTPTTYNDMMSGHATTGPCVEGSNKGYHMRHSFIGYIVDSPPISSLLPRLLNTLAIDRKVQYGH